MNTTDVSALAAQMRAAAVKAQQWMVKWYDEWPDVNEWGMEWETIPAKYIALCSPANVLAILDQMEKMEKEIEGLKQEASDD